MLKFLVKEAEKEAKGCIIWMHGLGANSLDMAGLAQELSIDNAHLRHIFLDAPIRSVSINQGMPMQAWYDIYNLSFTNREDADGVLESQEQISEIIATQIEKGIPSKHIVLAGFSQGGAMALYTGLQQTVLGGIIALSSYLPLSSRCQAKLHTNTPIFFAYGTQDTIVLPIWSKMSLDWLKQSGFLNLTCHDYPMEHTICTQEVADISQWITRLINGWTL